MIDVKDVMAAIVNVYETGRVKGDYGAIAVLKGDKGHLSYGRSQVTLGSGNLFKMLDRYCRQQAGDGTKPPFADELKPFLPRLAQKDFDLDNDSNLRSLLQRAGREDPLMRATQDQFFNENYLGPACRAAEAIGVAVPLGRAVIYDSHIQGGWALLQPKIGPLTPRGEQDWVERYIGLRREWLCGLRPPLPGTVYRMDSFTALIERENWQLNLPLTVHGVTVTEEALTGGDLPLPGQPKRVLKLTSPYMRGNDVGLLQRALEIRDDGIYGPFADAAVKKFQRSKGISEQGAGSETRQALGL
jgi:chitosanase